VNRDPSQTAGAATKLRGVPRKGERIAGVYQVEGVVGLGGMGAVLSAVHVELKQRVAIKVMLAQGARKKIAVARFLREARAASAIQCEHVVRIIDVGRLKNGLPYMVMEFLPGLSLQDRLDKGGPLPVQEAIDCVLQACEAIANAHAIGVVHRDLKPANLFLAHRADGSTFVKVLDFGISKAEWAGDPDFQPELTQTTDIMGTPTYMSPEQVRSSKNVDWRTDIWSLGAVLYELCTGAPPFWADSLPALSAMIVSDSPMPPSQRRAGIPPEIEACILRCLEKDPGARPQTVQEIAAWLEPWAPPASADTLSRLRRVPPPNWVPVTLGDAPADLDLDNVTLPPTADGWGTTAHEAQGGRSRFMVAALLVAGVGAAALATAMFFASSESEPTTRSSAASPIASSAPALPSMAAPQESVQPPPPPTTLASSASASASSSKPPKPVPKTGSPGIRRDPLDVRY